MISTSHVQDWWCAKVGGVQKSHIFFDFCRICIGAAPLFFASGPSDTDTMLYIYISKKNGKCVIACYNGTEPIIWVENSAGLIIWVETTGTGPAVLGHSFGFSVMYR